MIRPSYDPSGVILLKINIRIRDFPDNPVSKFGEFIILAGQIGSYTLPAHQREIVSSPKIVHI